MVHHGWAPDMSEELILRHVGEESAYLKGHRDREDNRSGGPNGVDRDVQEASRCVSR